MNRVVEPEPPQVFSVSKLHELWDPFTVWLCADPRITVEEVGFKDCPWLVPLERPRTS